MSRSWLRLTPWKAVFVVIMAAGLYATGLRFMKGLGAATNLSDQFPWGIWVGFDVLCGVGLAAGGFTLTAAVYLFNLEKYRPIVRPTILTAYLGYLLVSTALLYDLGRPYRIWHALIMWNAHSVMFEVAWCVMLYTGVLTAEFLPLLLEKIGWLYPARFIRKFTIPLVLLGVILSTLHQSSLGTVYLLMNGKLHPLWYTPMLPFLFYLSAISVGLAMTIFESFMSWRAFRKHLELPLLDGLARTAAVILAVYLVLRFETLLAAGALHYLIVPQTETFYFWFEVLLGGIVPLVMFVQKRVRRSPAALFWASVFTVLGFVTNRLNVSLTGMMRASGVDYFPRWTEMVITLMLVAAGFAGFALAVRYLPIFGEKPHAAEAPQLATQPLVQRAVPQSGD